MPRIMDDGLNTFRIQDNISNSELEVYYRMPATEERTAFSNEAIQRKRNQVVFRTAQTRLKFGLKILTGIREGDFIVKKEGKNVSLISNSNADGYDPEWKQKMKTYASDIVELLAAHVFENPAEALETDDDDNLMAEDAEKN